MNPTAGSVPMGSPTSALPAVPRRPLRLVDLSWHLPFVVLLVVGAAMVSSEDRPQVRLCLLLCAVAAYLTLRRWAVWSWLATLGVVPAVVGVGLLDLSDESVAWSTVALCAAVSAGLAAATWQARRWLVAVALTGIGTAAGLVAAVQVGSTSPARLSWNAASTFFVLAVPAAAAMFAAVGLARAEPCRPLRLACGMLTVAPLVALMIGHGDAGAALVWWPAGGALGLTALIRGRRGGARSQSDEVDDEAMAALALAHPAMTLAPVAIVIAAYNEADGIAGVIAQLPDTVCGMPAEVVVVDDGSRDETASVAAAAVADLGRGYVVACAANRGQGAALRLGYRVAREHGAAYIITTDADGQYDVTEMAFVLRPVMEGRADFVTGSRRLGSLHNHDVVRQLGTYVFAWLASALLARRITDTSFGLRAMRPEVTARVTLDQPQYQASELLLGAASHDFTVLEVPGTMNRRTAGSSKKGGNLTYGYRYARVMLGTWWREGAPRPVTQSAPALRSVGRAGPGTIR